MSFLFTIFGYASESFWVFYMYSCLIISLYPCRYKEKRWDSRRMLGSGGMPSSHSATVTALAVAIGCQDGTGGSTFAIAVVLACVVCNS